MSEDPATGALRPIDFDRLQNYMPELKHSGIRIKSIPFCHLSILPMYNLLFGNALYEPFRKT